jgi:tRNA 5-methylaminomethyl-2-thiouridine biosynthesis bifunctional protein
MSNPAAGTGEVADWSQAGPPRSRRHGDVYFSAQDGLAETRAVFLDGCGLPGAWSGRADFCVGELGFGVGLNVAALIDLWRATRSADARLHVFTVDDDLPLAAEAARALRRWPELADVGERLAARWPGRARGFCRIDLPEFGAVVDVAQMEAAKALDLWMGQADAWFLDGFAPALDPRIWRDEVLGLLARRSRPGARAATYTVAGDVRRGLAAAGFEVSRQSGHGRKRQRLEARWPGETRAPRDAPRVAIVGGGIAGASLARAFAALGQTVTLFEGARPGAGASGVPVALTAPRLDAGLGPPAQLFAQGAVRARDLFSGVAGAVLAQGVTQLATDERDAIRFDAVAGSDLFEAGAMTLLTGEEARMRLAEPAGGALAIATALAVMPDEILQAWILDPRRERVSRLDAEDGTWRILGEDDQVLGRFDVVCVAAGPRSGDLAALAPLTPVRGQATLIHGLATPAVSFGAYAAPTRTGALFGATHDRGDTSLEPRDEDDRRNLAGLARVLPQLAGKAAGRPRQAWVGVRATTTDYLPLAGPVGPGAPGLFTLCGLGSRGFCLAPLLGEHVAALAVGAPSPLPRHLADLVDPDRFARRAARRDRGDRRR